MCVRMHMTSGPLPREEAEAGTAQEGDGSGEARHWGTGGPAEPNETRGRAGVRQGQTRQVGMGAERPGGAPMRAGRSGRVRRGNVVGQR
ncbi:hypothetical protein GCM10023205_49120 [Yinghuangia aomiensis]|uniref:Uncharacterized protein n=1 Tax=Yinghuangia aomiensis TaxID=676205 RepID=A0ABP9HR82_9ACTN